MPESKKSPGIAVVAPTALLGMGILVFILLAFQGLLASVLLILPIALVVLGFVAVGMQVYMFSYQEEEKTTSDEKPEILPETANPEILLETANGEASKNAEKAKTKLVSILKKNKLDFDQAEAGIRINSSGKIAGVEVFYLTYELIGDLFKNFQETADQNDEFVRGKAMILQLLPCSKENSAIQINDVMALDENIRLFPESSIKSDPVLSQVAQPTPSTDSKPQFPKDLHMRGIQKRTKDSEPITEEQKVEFKKQIADVFKSDQLSPAESDILTNFSINLCKDFPLGLQGGTYYQFYALLVGTSVVHEWSTWLAWAKEKIDKSFSWPRSGPSEPLHVNTCEDQDFESTTVKLVVRADAIQQLLEAKKDVSSLGLPSSGNI